MRPRSLWVMVLGLVPLFAMAFAPTAAAAERTRGSRDPAHAESSSAVTFTWDTNAVFPGMGWSAVAWGDYDGDGDPDLALSGYCTATGYTTTLYRNDGGGVFADAGAPLAGVDLGAQAWGDYDNDGDLDLVLIGAGAGYVGSIYRNDGGTFTDAGAGLSTECNGSVAWGDYDNDGDLDLLVSGWRTYRVTTLYRNDGGGTFTDVGIGWPAVEYSSAAWGDYDNDGDLDLVLTGDTGSGYIAKLYRNDGGGNFTEVPAGFPGVNQGAAAWGDYDNDGDLDLLLAGDTGSGYVTRVYRNDGGGTFTSAVAGLPGIASGAVAWGDYDNDGDLDLALTGNSGATDITRIYRNDGGNVFNDLGAGLPGLENSALAWADYDGDGDLDLVIAGNYGTDYLTRIYRNDGSPADEAPAAPTGLSSSVVGNRLTLSWSASSDGETPAAGLSYNLRVGTTPGGDEILSAMADSATGDRLLPQIGNAQKRTSWTVTLPAAGRFYWSVQAVDAGFVGSAFAPEQHADYVTFTEIPVGFTGVIWASADWGDFDDDGDLDLVYAGSALSGPMTRVYRNDGGGTFTDVNAAIPGLEYCSVAWGDYDNDSTLDLLVTGCKDAPCNEVVSLVAHNDGSGTFTNAFAQLPGVSYGTGAWGDFDNDGDQDLVLVGTTTGLSTGGIAKVFRNDGPGALPNSVVFTDIDAGLTGVAFAAAAWGDYDNDGDLDLVVSGYAANPIYSPITTLYRNDGGGTFTPVSTPFPGVDYPALAWGDYDGDGDLDLAIAGKTSSNNPVTYVFRNDSGTFTDVAAGLPGMDEGTLSWGDYDHDGDLDLLILGGGNGRIGAVYRCDGPSTFTDIGAGLPDLDIGQATWGDYDADGDLDLLVVGHGVLATAQSAKIFRCDGAPANAPPSAPTNLMVDGDPGALTFSWDASTDDATPSSGLSYNLRIGTTPGGSEIRSPMASLTGARRVARLGNAQTRTSWTFDLPGGTYYWSVQAIDGALAGSEFAPEDGVVPALASLVSIDAGSDGVHVTWFVAGSSSPSATVERRTEGTDWVAIGQVVPDGTGYLRYQDGTAVAGNRYGYRLTLLDGGEPVHVGEVWIDVPPGPAFALEGVWPNPASDGRLTVQFMLASADPARIEVVDLQGRRIEREPVAGSGRHVVRLGRGGGLPAGMYVVRLVQGGRVATARAVVLR